MRDGDEELNVLVYSNDISNDILTFSPTTTRCLQVVYVINKLDIHV